jgi:hypothetical protein
MRIYFRFGLEADMRRSSESHAMWRRADVAHGPNRTSGDSFDAAPQLHQTGHSSIVQHFRRVKVGRAGRSGHQPTSQKEAGESIDLRVEQRAYSKRQYGCGPTDQHRFTSGSPPRAERPEAFQRTDGKERRHRHPRR